MNIEPAVSFDDVLIVPQYSTLKSRDDVCLIQGDADIPIISSNMDTITGKKMILKMFDLGGLSIIPRYTSYTNIEDLITWRSTVGDDIPLIFSVGINDFNIVKEIYAKKGFNFVCVDVAHANNEHVLNFIKLCKELDSDRYIFAGNVCTVEGAKNLINAGANIIKVGIGNGSACTTRIKTGCGYPQLQAIIDIRAHFPNIGIIADGGIRNSGDAAKALGAGADYVMIGGMLAGTDCTPKWDLPGDTITFRGMASLATKEEYGLPLEHEEGISTDIKKLPEGSTEKVIRELIDGITSAMSYVGATYFEEFRDKCKFVRVSSNTLHENKPHFLSK